MVFCRKVGQIGWEMLCYWQNFLQLVRQCNVYTVSPLFAWKLDLVLYSLIADFFCIKTIHYMLNSQVWEVRNIITENGLWWYAYSKAASSRVFQFQCIEMQWLVYTNNQFKTWGELVWMVLKILMRTRNMVMRSVIRPGITCRSGSGWGSRAKIKSVKKHRMNLSYPSKIFLSSNKLASLEATLVRNYNPPTYWRGWGVELLA